MSIKTVDGDLLREQTDAIVNTVNCVGVMGKGIALQFKRKWPANFKAYLKACKDGDLKPGKLLIYDLGSLAGKPYFIVNFPTKNHWKEKSKISYIESGLSELANFIRANNISSISIPPLGCGSGGLDWSEVKPLIERSMRPFENLLEIHLFEPKGAPPARSLETKTQKPKMTLGRAVLIKLLSIYRSMVLSNIEVQKLCYFAQVLGQPLKLNFVKNQFGPYADNLRHVLDHINGHYIQGVGDFDTSKSEISLAEGALDEAELELKKDQESNRRIELISNLIEGFETPYGLELLATVHWVANDPDVKNPDQVILGVHNWVPSRPQWNERKKVLMQESHISAALSRLKDFGLSKIDIT